MAKRIPLTQGYFTIVDDEDYEELCKYNWQTHIDQRGFMYAVKGIPRGLKNIPNRMHRIILNAKNNETVDHINHNTLDNRKKNLRICTKAQNSANSKGRKKRLHKYKGIAKTTDGGRWQAQITFNYKRIYLGCFKTMEEAAKAYNDAAIKYHGEFACLNKIKK